MNVVQFRPYRVRKIVESDFLNPAASTFNKDFATEDLRKSGLTLDDMFAYAVDNLILPEGAHKGYLIPYWNLNGDVISDKERNVLMYRLKLAYPTFAQGQRYSQPSSEELLSHGLPEFLPYLYPCGELEAGTIYCCEGEKKTAAFIKHLGLAAFGIGGCNMWGNPARTGGLHPWISDYLSLRGSKKVIIVPDGDVFRYDICRAYGTFAHALLQAGFEVELLNPPGKIDDIIVSWGESAREHIKSVPKLTPAQLVQSPAQLAVQYDLSFKRSLSGTVTVHQNTSNIVKLMEGHDAFPKIWRNLDNNHVYVGDDKAVPGSSEMLLANHIQHNFGLEKVAPSTVLACVQHLAKKHERSPFLEYVRGVRWDKQPRLDRWLVDLWGMEDCDHVREVGAKWLISSCARLDKPGAKVDWMMIVIGPQATGKTSMPGILFKGNATTIFGDHTDKDFKMLLHSGLVVSLDELDSFTRKESTMLKALITETTDMFRPPYGHSVEMFPRRFTLYGSGNRHDFLQHDSSGLRRYGIVQCKRLLNFQGLIAARDQLWAEAWFRYQAGATSWWKIDNASEIAEDYLIPNPLKEKFSAAITVQMQNDPTGLQFTMAQLLMWMGVEKAFASHEVRELSALVREAGFERKRVRNKITKRVERMYVLDDSDVV